MRLTRTELLHGRIPGIIAIVALTLMAALMIGPIREETAIVDETTFMGGGFGYFQTGSTKMAEENPLLGCMVISIAT